MEGQKAKKGSVANENHLSPTPFSSSRLSGIATGDQGIFVERRHFAALGGYADIPLMEDVELCRRLKVHARPPVCLFP